MNKEYKIKLDLNKKLYNKKMAFNQFDENVNDFYIEITKNNEVVKDLDKSIVTLVAIKPNGEVDAQFIEVKEGQIYADLKPSMCDLVGNYQAKVIIALEGEIVTTDTINYSVNEDKIISRLNDDIVSDERFMLFTDALARLSTIEITEEQRIVNEAERIVAEENRKKEESKRVETELVRQHEEADRAKYDATRESNENIRKQNESIRLANETNRIDEEAKRVEEENKRKLAEEERNANYNFMTEDEERRRSEANAHKETEVLRVQAETNRVNEEAKRRTIEQARVSAENTRVSNENTREANEVVRKNNENQRVEAETQRQSRYNSFIADAEANAYNFENYTNNAKVNEEERKSNELDRKSQEAKRVANEVERISNENTRKANEVTRIESEKQRADAENLRKEKIIEIQSDYDSLKKVIIDENASANLQNQINQTNSQLEHKANYNTVWNMANMGQDVKEAMTGGSVAVVGKNTILTENIIDGQVTRGKTNFYIIDTTGNLIDRDSIVRGKYIDNTGVEKDGKNETDFISIDPTKSYKHNIFSYVTYWDSNKKYISGYIEGSASVDMPLALKNIPPNVSYVRFSLDDIALDTCVISESQYFSNNLKTKYMDKNIVIKKSQIIDFNVSQKDITSKLDRNILDFYSISDLGNLFIPSSVIEGGYYNNSGTWVKSNNHVSTDFISIDPTKSYKHNIFSYVTYWDSNKNYISGYIEPHAKENPQLLKSIPENAKYVRFSVELADISTTVVSRKEVFALDLTTKYEEGDFIINENNLGYDLAQKINSSSSVVAGKIINFLGDSITFGFDGTDSTRVSKPYPTLVGEILGTTVNNYGISGSTIGGDGVTSTEHNVLGNTPMNIRYADMDSTANYILVLGGVNDYCVDRRIPLGSKGDTTNLTFYGALKILIEGLIAKYPNSRIGFITPLRKINDHNLNVYGNHLKEYRNAIIEMCEEYSIPVLDLFTKGGCYANITDWRIQNLPDGLHPNQSFYEKMAIQIANFIESM